MYHGNKSVTKKLLKNLIFFFFLFLNENKYVVVSK